MSRSNSSRLMILSVPTAALCTFGALVSLSLSSLESASRKLCRLVEVHAVTEGRTETRLDRLAPYPLGVGRARGHVQIAEVVPHRLERDFPAVVLRVLGEVL